MMNVETSEIQTIEIIKAPHILTCIGRCRDYTIPPPDPASGLPPRCNTVSYDDTSSNCELLFITGLVKWDSRNAAPSSTTKVVWTRMGYNATTGI